MKSNKFIFGLFLIGSMLLYTVPGISNYAGLIALILGITLSTTDKFYKPPKLNEYRKKVLNISVVFFGFSLNINEVIAIGSKGIIVSFISLIIVITSGYCLIKVLNFDEITGKLTTYGSAICGGSAISAVSGVLNPTSQQIAISTAIVFVLNGVALAVFPTVGHLLHMTQTQFGVFAALSIHDVSSVVGAASIYGDGALQIATILKLTRTLWIIPIVLILSYNKGSEAKVTLPLFIVGFVLASIISTVANNDFVTQLNVIGKYLLPIALFMVGYAIKVQDIKETGLKGMIFGVTLWGISIVTGLTLAFAW